MNVYDHLSDVPGFTITRTHAGFTNAYAETPDGRLLSFAANVARNVPGRGVLIEPERTNKATNTNLNPTTTTGLTKSGDAAATLAVAADSAALAAIGLVGNVYVLNNSAGAAAASVRFTGTTGNTNPHVVSAHVRGGTGNIRLFPGAISTFGASAGYVRRTGADAAPSSTSAMIINADPGQILYFILTQLEEGDAATSPIPVSGSTATRGADVPGLAGLAVGAAGTLAFEFIGPPSSANYPRVGMLTDTATAPANKVDLLVSGGSVYLATKSNGVASADINVGSGVVAGALCKVAVAWNGAALTMALNGVTSTGTMTAGAFTALLAHLIPGRFSDDNSATLNSYLKRPAVYKRALSAAELQTLTAMPYPGAIYVIDPLGLGTGGVPYFRGNGGEGSSPAVIGLTCSRPHTGFTYAFAEMAGGKLRPFAADKLRWIDRGFLVEESRLMLGRQHCAMELAPWSAASGAVVTGGLYVAPDGTTRGSRVTLTTSGSSRLDSSTTYVAVNGETVTGSVYAMGTGQTRPVGVTTTTGVGGSSEPLVTLTAAWKRYSAFVTFAAPTGNYRQFSPIRRGDSATECAVFGGQLEIGKFATSLCDIGATSGTRGPEVVSFPAVLGAEYTVFLEAVRKQQFGAGFPSALSFGTTDTLSISDATGGIEAKMGGGTFNAGTGANVADGGIAKWAFRSKVNDARLVGNGQLSILDTSFTPTTGPVTAYIGSQAGVQNWWNDCIRRLVIYSNGKTDAQLTALFV